PLQASAKIPSKSKNIKQLYLFARNAKIFKDLHFRTRAKRGTGAVALWPLSSWPMTSLNP
ncbi:MAG TPA: hypothetical protein VH280_22780, partial [Verrucomicrobiae bacterium]|nr:hypothetical protein [Verrucomicrobiae bacterium]